MPSDSERITYNQRVVDEFRANKGRVEGWGPLILLTIKGAKTGQPRTYPLMKVPYEGTYLAVASKGGAPKHPQWYHNLVAHPDVTVETGDETFQATARQLSGEDRERAFAQAAEVFTPYADYQKRTSREIPVFVLERKA